ncbi:MAG: PAS domain S-box protein, partial [bacterium]|nr:PAS domain S-box protein [bacterium]
KKKKAKDELVRGKSILEKIVHKKSGELKEEIKGRKQVEESLQETEARYKALFETAGDGIYINDLQGRFLDFNLAAHQRLGYSREEYLELSLTDIVSSEYAMVIPKRIEELKQKGQTFFESEHKHKDGSLLKVELNSKLIEYSGQPAILTIARDISKRVAIELKLRQAQKLEAIGTLASGIAHDFNNILSAIFGYTELALGDVQTGSKADKSLKKLMNAAKRGKDLVRQILTFCRQSKPEKITMDIVPIINEALKLLHSTLSSSIEIRKNLPETSHAVNADPSQIHQIILNLCVNAAHAMKENGGILEVSLEKTMRENESPDDTHLIPGEYLKLSIKDSGHGIPPEVAKQIFEPFFTTKKKGEGTGLGLSVVHGIIQDHKGDIVLHSEPGKGTRFDVFLPLKQNPP